MATNWALASEGATVNATNAYSYGPGGTYDKYWINNGGVPRYDGDDTHTYFADVTEAITIEFSGSQTITSVVVWSNDGTFRASDPAEDEVDAGGYAPEQYTISTWNGSSWDEQISFNGTAYLRHTSTFPSPVATTKILLVFTASSSGLVAIQEIEAWEEDSIPTGVAQGTSTAQAVGFPHFKLAAASTAGIAACSGAGMAISPGPPVCWNSADKDSGITLSDGGRIASAGASSFGYTVRATKPRDRGKLYFEIDLSTTGNGAAVGLAGVSRSPRGRVYYNPNSSGGIMMYSASSSYSLAREYTSQGTLQPRKFRFAIDFEACRIWIGDENGWRGPGSGYGANPATGDNPTLSDNTVGLIELAPWFQSSQTGTSRAVLRTAYHDFSYPIPTGFLPWDDYLDASIAKGVAAGTGGATGRLPLAVATGSGLGATQGTSSRVISAVGAASTTGSAEACSPGVIGAASGITTVLGRGKPVVLRSVAASAGSSSAVATGVRARVGVGSASGVAVPYVHTPMRELDAVSSATLTPFFAYSLKDGYTLLSDNSPGYYVDSTPGTTTLTATWASNKIVNGIELYSSAWCRASFIGETPDGSETFPVNVGGATTLQIQYDTTGTGVWADVLPVIYNNSFIRRTVIFPSWLTTKAVRVIATSDSDYIRLSEFKVFTPSILYIAEIEDVVVETSTLLAVHAVDAESTADAASTLTGTGYALLEDGGNATSSEASTWTYKAVGAARGTSAASAKTLLQVELEDGGEATATLTFARSLKLQSAGALSTLLSSNLTHTEESTGEASDNIQGENSITRVEESTGVASDTVIGIRRVTVIEISGGDTQASSAAGSLAGTTLVSSGLAVSIAVQHSLQTVTLESIGNAEETLPAPFQGSYPIFWTNSVSAGAATWEGLPFNSLIEADGVVYAAGPSGIFELGDEMDDLSSDIASEVEWDLVDNGSVQMKRMRSVYVNARTSAPFTVRVANEQGVFNYPTSAADTDTVTNHRAAVGRGIVSRNVRLSLLHTKHFEAENAGVGILESKRRI